MERTPDDCVVVWCSECRDTGWIDVPDPEGRDDAVLVRPCPRCGQLTRPDRIERWRRAEQQERRKVREWRERGPY